MICPFFPMLFFSGAWWWPGWDAGDTIWLSRRTSKQIWGQACGIWIYFNLFHFFDCIFGVVRAGPVQFGSIWFVAFFELRKLWWFFRFCSGLGDGDQAAPLHEAHSEPSHATQNQEEIREATGFSQCQEGRWSIVYSHSFSMCFFPLSPLQTIY